MFEVTAAKKEILTALVQQDWTPSDLADYLDKSTSTVYNHLDELAGQGLLQKQKVEAKTRPKTSYSIGQGFLYYIAVLPGQYRERSFKLTPEKEAIIRIWNIPQEEFHPALQELWWEFWTGGIDIDQSIAAIGVYGSVARGDADQESDIDILVIANDQKTAELVDENWGSLLLENTGNSKIAVTETFTREEYRNSWAHGSDFLESVIQEIHAFFDPENILSHPANAVNEDEQ